MVLKGGGVSLAATAVLVSGFWTTPWDTGRPSLKVGQPGRPVAPPRSLPTAVNRQVRPVPAGQSASMLGPEGHATRLYLVHPGRMK